MKTKRRLILWLLYVIAMLAFAAWLAFSNSWIAASSSETAVKEASFADYPGRSLIRIVPDSVAITDPLTERLTVMGYYMAAEENALESAQMALLLSNGQDCYELSLELDESKALALRYDNIAFYCNVSLLPVNTGTYDLYLYCRENEEYYGMLYTGYQVEKTDTGVAVYRWTGAKADTRQQPAQEETLFGGLEWVHLEDNSVQIQGWAGLDELDNCVQGAWIEFTDEAGNAVQFTARQMLRQDVGYKYGENYTYSGFYTRFPAEELADGIYTVRALLEQEGEIRPTAKYTLAVHDQSLTLARGAVRPRGWAPVEMQNLDGDAYVTNVIESGISLDRTVQFCAISGWSTVYTDGSEDDRQVSLVLDGDAGCYQAAAELAARPDVAAAFPTSGIKNEKVGFSVALFAGDVPEGDYKLYLYDRENETDAGLMDTYYRVSVTPEGLCFSRFAGERSDKNIEATEDTPATGGVDLINSQNNCLNIGGWLAVTGQSSEDQRVLLELTDPEGKATQYTTEQILRPDVAAAYGELCEKSGFFTSIPMQELPDGVYTLRMLQENAGEVYQTAASTVAIYGDRLTYEREEISYQKARQAELDSFMGNRWVTLSLESPVQLDRELLLCKLYGWARVDTDGGESGRQISLVLDGDEGCYQVPAELVARPDVPAAFPDMGIKNEKVGFSATLFAGDVPEGDYKLYLYDRENGSDAGLTDTYYRVSVRSEGMRFSRFTGERSDKNIEAAADTPAAGNVDTVGCQDDHVNVVGWLAVIGQSSEDQRILLELTDPNGAVTQYTAEQILRSDVGAALGDKCYNNSGFFTAIPLEDIADGTYTLRAIVQNGETVLYSVPYTLTRSGETVTCGRAEG